MGIGHLVGRNQSRSVNTVITFPNPHANFPFPSSFSTCLLPVLPLSFSSAAPSLPLHLPLLSLIFDPAETLRLRFYSLACPALYTFLSPLFLGPLSSLSYPPMPTPPPPSWLLTGAYFTMAHIKQPDEGNTVRLFAFFQRSMIPHKGTLCVHVCVFPLTLVRNIKDARTNWVSLFCTRRRMQVFSTESHFIKLYILDSLSGEAFLLQPRCSGNGLDSSGPNAGFRFSLICIGRTTMS